jgi:hypothetical protein
MRYNGVNGFFRFFMPGNAGTKEFDMLERASWPRVGLTAAFAAMSLLAACANPASSDDVGSGRSSSAAVWFLNDAGDSATMISTAPPHARFTHQAATFENNGNIVLVVNYNPIVLTVTGFSDDSTISSASIDVVYQVNGEERQETSISVPWSGDIFFYSGTFSPSPEGLDFWDADGDGAYLDLAAHPDSSDYPLVGITEVRVDETAVWTSPDY